MLGGGSSLRISSMTRSLGVAVVLAALSVVAVTAISWDGIRIGGSRYAHLVDNKDLTADILPPPLYVLESYAHALDAETPAEARAASSRIRALKAEFESRLNYWRDRDLDPRLKSLLFDKSGPAASRFFTVALDHYLPAVEAGDPQAIAKARAELKAAYMAQRAVVDLMIPLASENVATGEAAATSAVTRTQLIVGILMLLLALLALFNVFIVAHRVSRPLANMKDFMLRLAEGDLSRQPPYQGRGDEVGEMARAVQVFRQNALDLQSSTRDRLASERSAEQSRLAAEAGRQRQAQEQRVVLDGLAASLARLAAADLSGRISGLPAAYEPLQNDFNRALDVLGRTLGSVVEVVEQFHRGAEELSGASDNLSRRTERQAASLEETAAAIDQLTATVRQVASGAAEAASLAAAARGEAAASSATVEGAVTAMQAISHSSEQIAQIIGVVDEIAFQTNLLALNAGVEAARAGDAGKGFAVVAFEVRALAQRSAEAAKEIKALVADSASHVLRGVDLVAATGQALNGINARVTQIDELVSGLASASREQATGLQEVNVAVNEMDQVTQANAAMVEQSAAAINSLKADAARLRGMVGAFKLGGAAPTILPGRRVSAGAAA